MSSQSYFPNYYSVEDIMVTQERVECKVNTKLLKMGFLESGAETEDLNTGRTVNIPLWYIKELKVNNPYYAVTVPDIYKNVHKAVCEAETTHIELGKLHPYFYEYGRYLTPYDRNHAVGRIVFETLRQRVRHLLDISKNTTENTNKPEHRLDNIETNLYEAGVKTNILYTNWLQMKANNISISEMVQEHCKKRKRDHVNDADDIAEQERKRTTM